MAKRIVTITNNSISNTVTDNINKAICEYIWNGFDAGATTVRLDYTDNGLSYVEQFSIQDDGEGIDRSLLGETFGRYQDSIKKRTFQWSSQVKGKKGKGRFAFNCFATKATWISIYKREDGDYIQHEVSISAGDNNKYDDKEDKVKKVRDVNTGTIVSFSNCNIPVALFDCKEFLIYLKKEFSVFLFLNKSTNKQILINGIELKYDDFIEDTESYTKTIIDEKTDTKIIFDIVFIRWSKKMKDKYYMYFLDSSQSERYETPTSLNNKDNGFHHSLYVTSSFFDNFVYKDNNNQQKLFPDNAVCQNDAVFKNLKRGLKTYLETKQKQYVSKVASKELIDKYTLKGIIRRPQNEFDAFLVNQVKDTIRTMYEVQPRIFINLKEDQAKTIVGMTELLLQSDKREDILKIMDSIVKMTDEERKTLAGVLENTTMSNITSVIKLLENRNRTISALKTAIYNKELGVNERDDLQKMIGKSFWIFGEKYNIVTEAEPDFNQALTRMLHMISKSKNGISKSKINEEKIKHPDVNKEMDIFALRQNIEDEKIENVVVELKHPNIKLGEVEVSQVKTYMNVITSEERFNASNMTWTFILVGNDFDKTRYIENEISSNKIWGKKGLIQHIDGPCTYEIYVKKWSEIFADFTIRYDFLMKQLKFKLENLSCSEIKSKEMLHDIIESCKEDEEECGTIDNDQNTISQKILQKSHLKIK